MTLPPNSHKCAKFSEGSFSGSMAPLISFACLNRQGLRHHVDSRAPCGIFGDGPHGCNAADRNNVQIKGEDVQGEQHAAERLTPPWSSDHRGK